jgi:hypothetical protein
MAKKISFKVILIVLALLVFSSCATTNKDGSPKWTTNVPTHWRTYYAVGYGKLTNIQNSKMRAEAAAIDDVARWASVTVKGALTNYFQDSESLTNTNLDLMESISKQIVDISLREIRVDKMWVDPNQGVWVLVSFPVKNLKAAYKQQSEKLARDAEIAKSELLIEYLEKELAKEGK